MRNDAGSGGRHRDPRRRLACRPGDQSLREQTIVVTDSKITSVEKGYQPAERYGAEARLVDLKDRFVLPGLIDLHKHISMPLDADRETVESETRLALMTAAIAKATLDAGVTTVRDIGRQRRRDLRRA